MEASTCEETINCIQIQESKRFTFEKRVLEVQQINENQYLVLAYGCTFALVDQNWNIINVQVLQNLENYNDLYVENGVEVEIKGFIVGDQGGCSAGSKIIVVNFKTLEVVFQQNNTNYDYSVSYVDSKNQIVFLSLFYVFYLNLKLYIYKLSHADRSWVISISSFGLKQIFKIQQYQLTKFG
ncbi:zinc finger protein (macronuclear) [Tetrahymena thermophila SB210]|uniref:Zinc finger protein n=1 Tax=Tetrahymena thermophila (strain SB210) TaxID=312017 RepID=Q22SP0_TETTS|nr:zinc finger protein [Tetrahymena thermophila SB210]EAR88295.2 zinc finger protein [Tetrahymena thermophila SB210]|eukprot:XP_001008540.2 zinc finger protein [Tetrahymena thermophila SB210]